MGYGLEWREGVYSTGQEFFEFYQKKKHMQMSGFEVYCDKLQYRFSITIHCLYYSIDTYNLPNNFSGMQKNLSYWH